jgi:dTDP-4-dehydrorhamnose 3,5-epimerase
MDFSFKALDIPDVLIVTHGIFSDPRGFFLESFREEPFLKMGIPRFVQDNHAKSVKGVLRGMHYQLHPASVGKLVRCLRGRIFDVAVDIRRSSPHYAQWVGVELTPDGCQMLYIPEGFAHGYCVLSEECEVFYKTTGYYSAAHDRGFRWDDPDVGIKWPVAEPVLSPKDANAPLFKDADNNFEYNDKRRPQASAPRH